MREPREVILRPVVTERSTELQEDMRTYTFIVSPEANKLEIKNAVQTLFNVKVESVRTANYQGKWRRMGKGMGRRPAYKKAMIRLAEGDTIDVYEGV